MGGGPDPADRCGLPLSTRWPRVERQVRGRGLHHRRSVVRARSRPSRKAGLQLGTSLTPFPTPKGDEITTTGTFALVRHPMYGGGILIALGWTIIFASVVGLAVTVVLALFLDLKSRREEIWLGERYDKYQAYREQTPHKLVPFIY